MVLLVSSRPRTTFKFEILLGSKSKLNSSLGTKRAHIHAAVNVPEDDRQVAAPTAPATLSDSKVVSATSRCFGRRAMRTGDHICLPFCACTTTRPYAVNQFLRGIVESWRCGFQERERIRHRSSKHQIQRSRSIQSAYTQVRTAKSGPITHSSARCIHVLHRITRINVSHRQYLFCNTTSTRVA